MGDTRTFAADKETVIKIWRSHLLLLAANLIYAASYPIARLAMPAYISPFGFILLRVCGAVLFFWCVGLFLKRERVRPKAFARFFLCAVFGVAVNQLSFFYGLSLTAPISASILMSATPIVTLALSVVFLKERITPLKTLGIISALAGALVLILNAERDPVIATDPLLGNFMILISAISYAVYLTMVKPLMARYSAFTVAKYMRLFGLIMVFPFGYREVASISWAALPEEAIFSVLYVVVMLSCLACWLILIAMKKARASTVGVYVYLQPGFSSIFAFLLGADSLNAVKIISMALIFFGVYLVSFQNQKARNV